MTEIETAGTITEAEYQQSIREMRIARYGAASVFRIPEENVSGLMARIETLNKRARRLHLAPITATFVREETETETIGGIEIERTFRLYDVQGTTPVLAGWHFVASLSKVEDQVLVTTASGQALPKQYLAADPTHCDHCGVKRARQTTFVVAHEDGRTAQVGRQCLADFIRTTNPEALAAQAEFLTSLGGFADEFEDGGQTAGGPDTRRYAAADFMAVAMRVIAREGHYVSKKASWAAGFKDGKPVLPSTVSLTLEAIRVVPEAPLTDEERARADEMLDWARTWTEREDLGDYEQNVKTVSRLAYWPAKAWGVGVSIIGAHARETTKAAERAAAPVSQWIGEPKKRAVFTLRLLATATAIESEQWGTSYLYRFADEAGNAVRYFASHEIGVPTTHTYTRRETVWKKGAPVYDCAFEHAEGAHNVFPSGDESKPWCEPKTEEKTYPVMRPIAAGDVVTMKATVKAHEEWKGQKQTLITRGVVQSLVTTEDDKSGGETK